jgi:hypothetical protein
MFFKTACNKRHLIYHINTKINRIGVALQSSCRVSSLLPKERFGGLEVSLTLPFLDGERTNGKSKAWGCK